jgi:glycosyltransferase involved in cell wall biosynthesis
MQTVAVVVTTYNNPKCLELCIRSFQNQTDTNFEIFIADDGSGDSTRDLVAKLKRECAFQIYHHWQPDQGYQKAKINNKVFAQINPAQYPILICIDHDVVVHYRFVEDHRRIHEASPGIQTLFMGRRVDLGPEVSEAVNADNVHDFNHGLNLALIRSALKGETKNILRSWRLDLPPWMTRLMKRDRVYDLLGSNFSMTTQLMIDVNGYNEDYRSYWGEDGDLFVRVRNRGANIVGRIGYAVQWHLHHPRLNETPEHIEMYRALLNDYDYKLCANGIRKFPNQQI